MSQIGTNTKQNLPFQNLYIISAGIGDRDIKIGHSNFYTIFKNRF